MFDLRIVRALSRFDPLPEDVKRRMVHLDHGDGVLDPFKSVPKVGPDFNGR